MALSLQSGSRVGIIGGGPAGSLFAHFLLTAARARQLELTVDIYEPRDFTRAGPGGCNMCGGIVSEWLVEALTRDGIELPPEVVQRWIDSYVLHTEREAVRVDTALGLKRIAAIYRGGGPSGFGVAKWCGLDGYLLGLAFRDGARLVPHRVTAAAWEDGRPTLSIGQRSQTYDLVAGASGVNSSGWNLFDALGFPGRRPVTERAFITELRLGREAISRSLGDSMHIFLLDIPGLYFAALIPKGEFVTVCLLGKKIDQSIVEQFFASEAVRGCLPEDWPAGRGACHCTPKINLREATRPAIDRAVLIGDCGVSRLYKDGIGAAYQTARAAALTAANHGISAKDFERHYLPTYEGIARDNRYGQFIFSQVHWSMALRPVSGGVLRLTADEQARSNTGRMSTVLWDMFTGSAPYRDISLRMLDPQLLTRLGWTIVRAVLPGTRPGPGALSGTDAHHHGDG